MPKTCISKEVFNRFPNFRRGIVVVHKMDNSGSSNELESLLSEALVNAATNPIDLKADLRTTAWTDLYRELGCNPNKFPPAHLALLKRIQKPGAMIPFINKTVAIMNDNSIRGLLPVGGDDLRQAGETLELRFAVGDERFIPLNEPDKTEFSDPGEVIYVVEETKEIMCRRWNWRNGFATRITEATQAIVMNIDGLGADNESHTISVRDRVAQMLQKYCGAEVETALLSPATPVFEFQL
jgi:DNA/RNA-binding domain of Phe-tRNA-synthetase-like protein